MAQLLEKNVKNDFQSQFKPENQNILEKSQNRKNDIFNDITNTHKYQQRHTSREKQRLPDDQSYKKETKLISDTFLEIRKKLQDDLDQYIKRQLQSIPTKETLQKYDSAQQLQLIQKMFGIVIKAYQDNEQELEDLKQKECSDYENMLQKLESEVRQHIRIEQQLKLYAESIQAKLDDAEKILKDGEGVYKKQIEQLTLENQQLKYNLGSKDKEIVQLKKEFNQKQESIKNMQEKLSTGISIQNNIPQHPQYSQSQTATYLRSTQQQKELQQSYISESAKNLQKKDNQYSTQQLREQNSTRNRVIEEKYHSNENNIDYSSLQSDKTKSQKLIEPFQEDELNNQLEEKDAEILKLEKKLKYIQKMKEQKEQEKSNKNYLQSSQNINKPKNNFQKPDNESGETTRRDNDKIDSQSNYDKMVATLSNINLMRKESQKQKNDQSHNEISQKHTKNSSQSSCRNMEDEEKQQKLSTRLGTSSNQCLIQNINSKKQIENQKITQSNNNVNYLRSKSVDQSQQNIRGNNQKSSQNDCINQKIRNYKNAYNSIIDKTTELLKQQNKYGLQKSQGKY